MSNIEHCSAAFHDEFMLILKKYFTLFQDMNCNEKNLDDCFLHLTDYEVSHMSHHAENLSPGFMTRSNTNWPLQSEKSVRRLKFWI